MKKSLIICLFFGLLLSQTSPSKASKDKVNITETLKNELTTLLVAPSRSRFFNNKTH